MKIIVAFGFLLGLSSAAFADATLTITLTGAGGANATRVLTLSDADGARMLAWAREAGPRVEIPPASADPQLCQRVVPPISTDPILCVPPFPAQCLATSAPANPMPAACLPTGRIMGAKEASEWLFTLILSDIREKVVLHDRTKASRAASDVIAPLVPK